MKDVYEILGLTSSASDAELIDRYNQLKNEYSEGRFQSGDAGNEAAVKLTELENAWLVISDDIKRRNAANQTGSTADEYGYVDSLIKQGKYTEAQEALDSIMTRTGQWHYLQAIIFYKREWLSESRAQLEKAIELDPYNDRYRMALEKMKMYNGNPRQNPETMGTDGNTQGQYAQEDTCTYCARCCAMNMCLNCMCNSMRCC